MNVLILALILLTSGCTTMVEQPAPHLLEEILGDPTEKPAGLVDVLALSEDLKAFIDERIDRNWRSSKRLQVLRSILFSPDLFAIEYESGNTKTAIETYESQSGNCLSMTNLFIAMARYSGLDANYHLVKARPEWEQSGNTLIWTQHINSTGLLRDGDRYVLDFLPQRGKPEQNIQSISDRYALAIYYNNLAAEAIIARDYKQALVSLRSALWLEPRMADAWNNMGATQRRLNRLDLAKASYQQAIVYDAFNNTAMSNLSRIYFNEGNQSLGDYYAEKVKRHRSKNPYYRYAQAKSALLSKDYEIARKELNAAILLKKDEAVFFDALAEAYRGLGDSEKSLISMQLAELIREDARTNRSSLEIYRSGNVFLQ